MAEPLPDYSDLHRLVDRLTLDQVRAVRAVVLQLVPQEPAETSNAGDDRPRRFSVTGIGHAGPDLAARSQDILRAELGDHPQ
ncbi:hypothetical protein [Kineosporia babensis]|uniref:Uncharacterized protein n=1 Tax=Kineosporia babensis TaxID=499548 RepID=A0A9X1N717_9ACTN|nr:hypothetical protein [Kineosporia babensis]MCD5309572.1 hypothetical protein [Kineosporia babensis]